MVTCFRQRRCVLFVCEIREDVTVSERDKAVRMYIYLHSLQNWVIASVLFQGRLVQFGIVVGVRCIYISVSLRFLSGALGIFGIIWWVGWKGFVCHQVLGVG